MEVVVMEEIATEPVVVEAVEKEESVNHEQIIVTPTTSQPEEEQFQQTATTEQEPVEAMEVVVMEEIATEPVVVEAVEKEESVNHEQIIVTPTTSQPEEEQFQQTATTEQEPVEAMEVVATEEIATEPVVMEAIEEEEPVIQEQIIVTPTITQPVEEQFQQQQTTVAVQEREEDLEQNQEVKLVGQAQTYEEELTIEEKPAIIEEVIYRAEEPEELATSENVSEEAPALVLDSIEIPMDPIKVHEQLDEMSSPTGEEGPTAIAEPVRTEESKLPFNVLMLKTDKEKWAAKEAKFKHDFQAEVVEHDTSITVIEKLMETKATAQSKQFTELEQPIAQNYDEEAVATTVEQVIEAAVEEPEPSRINENLDTSLQYLEPPEEKTEDFEWMDMQGGRLIEALSYFQVKGEIVQIVQGPAVTQFEITVGHGTKVSKIRNLADDLKLALAAKDIRIQAPIPGKSSIGIEIPNRSSRPVRISEIVGDHLFIDSDSPLEAALGLDLTGKPVTLDLRKMPHGLIAGATGSGKSVCINSILVSLLLKASPQDVKLLLIDPKMVELAAFNHIPHLVSPVITDVKAATAALKWAVEEMERRYQLFAHLGARDITRYNAMVEAERKFSLKMPYLVIVIDELADLMMMAPTDVEEAICRIAQKARACGMHLVLATQRPSVDVITGLIKSNIPTRIAFSVSSHIDSRTILDSQGAERLLGRGDMLYLGNGMSAPIRVQGTFVTDEEIEAVTGYMRSLGKPEYIFEQDELLKRAEAVEEQDELFEEACRHICEQGTVSTSSLQRKFHIGYNRAARLVDMMEAQGFISESKGTKPRDVFLKTQDLENLFNNAYDEM
ncbi:DUF87 domain-containing protein [Viridibacillus sp. YIM B01967]|uniref:DUF87 domain-containing protein n=2 Tax=Viridibacillus soli TaxID=2798301 RepID=A0ABS1HAL0_9BACL|nr:DUF87 domain-containing protein [Viridibacillus soli]